MLDQNAIGEILKKLGLGPKIKFKKLHKDSVLPKYQTSGAAGFDLNCLIDDSKIYKDQKISYNPEDPTVGYITIPARGTAILRTGLSVEIPDGTEMQIRSRSGLASKGIAVTNSPGTLDQDFRGEICILLINHNDTEVKIYNGDRIAQGVISWTPKFEIEEVQELSSTDRGAGGFGSTGLGINKQ